MNKMLYSREIEDELLIQFIILYALSNADEPLAYSDMLNIIQENCEISFTDLQIGLDNLLKTEHIVSRRISDILTLYDVTEKGRNVNDFFYRQIPLIIREPIDKSIKNMYLEKRRKNAVQATIEPINMNEFNALCKLYDDDSVNLMTLSLYAGSRDDAEKIAVYFKEHAAEVYGNILMMFNKEEKTDDKAEN